MSRNVGRPRKATDEQILEATYAVMNRVGPGELTLAAIAKEAGVTAGLLVQRFGSKKRLLLTLAERFSSGVGAMIDDLAKRHRSPVAALLAYAECMAGMAASPAAFARSLAYLQIDLTVPEFRRHLVKQARETRAALARIVRAALRAGELRRVANAARLARTLECVVSGSLMTWAFYQEGKAGRWLRADMEAALAPYRAPR